MISTIKTESSLKELRQALKSAKKRNPDAYLLLKIASSINEETIEKIANGDIEPSQTQHAQLAMLA